LSMPLAVRHEESLRQDHVDQEGPITAKGVSAPRNAWKSELERLAALGRIREDVRAAGADDGGCVLRGFFDLEGVLRCIRSGTPTRRPHRSVVHGCDQSTCLEPASAQLPAAQKCIDRSR